jgi:hypothetical protein
MIYDFISIQSKNMIKKDSTNAQLISSTLRKQIIDAIAWTQMMMKMNYDRKHISMNIKIEDFALLRFHKDYNIFVTKILERKLSQQYVDSFKMLEKIENLVYRMNVSQDWRIHSVVSIAQLESMPNSITDSFSRSRSIESKSIEMKSDTNRVKFFEIERLIDRRITTRREIEYLVRWKDWKSQYDEWRNVLELQNVKKLIDEYNHNMNSFITLSDRIFREKFDTTIFKSVNISFFEFIINNSLLTKVIMTNSNQNRSFDIQNLRRFFRSNKDITRTWWSFLKRTYVTIISQYHHFSL